MKKTIRIISGVTDYPETKRTFQFNWHQTQSNNPNSILYGYFYNDKLVGLIDFEPYFDSYYNYVYDLEVVKSYRGKHIGTQLLAQVMIDSFQRPDFDGFVALDSKTDGTEKYYQHLNGFFTGLQRVIFDSTTSQKIIGDYLPEGGLLND